MRLNRSAFVGLMMGTSLLALTGCVPLVVGAAVGAGGMAYVQGLLAQNVDRSVDQVNNAALAVLKRLKYFPAQEELDRRLAKISALDEDGRKIQITVEALTEQASRISIRIGAFGDEVKSQKIMTEILNKLGIRYNK